MKNSLAIKHYEKLCIAAQLLKLNLNYFAKFSKELLKCVETLFPVRATRKPHILEKPLAFLTN